MISRPILLLRAAACALLFGAMGASDARSQAADSFATAMQTAMDRMDHDMMVPSTGDPDRDFATMMIPHHQGAVDMATAELRFGHDPVLRRLAEGIIVEQQQEIVVMRQALAKLPQPTPLSGGTNASHKQDH